MKHAAQSVQIMLLRIFGDLKELFHQKRFDILLLMVIAFFPIYRYSFSGVLMPIFGVSVIILHYFKRPKFQKNTFFEKFRYFLITAGFFLILAVSILYTSNREFGLLILVHGLYLIIYPFLFIFFVEDITKKHLQQIFFSFLTACGVYFVYIQYSFFNAGLYTNFRPAEFNELPFRDVVMTLPFGSIHPTYISMWFLFSALYLIHFLFENKTSVYVQILIIVGICVLVFSSVILSVKITMLAFFFSSLLLFYLMVKNKLVMGLSVLMIVIVFIFGVFNISFLRARFVDEFKATELKPPVGLATNSLNIRVGIFDCSVEVFKDNWLFGTGVGDSQEELNKCYTSFQTNVYKEHNYDTHNNFFDIAIATGIIGLLAFVGMLVFHISESIRYGNTLFLVFLAFMVVCMLPENILSRNHGVVFYSLFSSLFIKQNLIHRTFNDRSKR
jgi:O-antigen ligase